MSDQNTIVAEKKAHRAGPLNRLSADQMRRSLFFLVPHGITADEAMDPAYLRHFAAQVSVNDIVELVSESGEFDIMARVTSVKPGLVRLRPMFAYLNEAKEVADPVEASNVSTENLSVDFAAKHGWRIVTDSGSVLAKGYATREEAVEAKRNYIANPSLPIAA